MLYSLNGIEEDINMPAKKSHTGYRDANTGLFVKREFADKHPKTTIKESIPNPGRGDTEKSKSNPPKAPQQKGKSK